MDRQPHWDRLYASKALEEVSWYQSRPALSLELIESSVVGPSGAILDVGGGDSLLVDHLLEAGYTDLTVLDVSSAALDRARRRLEDVADQVGWIVTDVTRFRPEREYDLWHDRAAFHFLTRAGDRRRYVTTLERALRAGGQAILATFSLEGPARCSGLDVRRYSAASLAAELGRSFRLVESRTESHRTPSGADQSFVYGRFQELGRQLAMNPVE